MDMTPPWDEPRTDRPVTTGLNEHADVRGVATLSMRIWRIHGDTTNMHYVSDSATAKAEKSFKSS
jgi:hypothetical protein